MNWKHLRIAPWLDTRARFVAGAPQGGSLLDIGSSDGETLSHLNELRPDLKFYATDLEGHPENYPEGCQFHRGDLQKVPLPWPDNSLDTITCMHLVEHLEDLTLMLSETMRLLKPGGRIYIETPHPRSLTMPSPTGKSAGTFTLNFYDDITHVKIVSMGALAQHARKAGLEIAASGTSRNWLFAAAHPLLSLFPDSRKKFTARIHWVGWSAYLIAQKP